MTSPDVVVRVGRQPGPELRYCIRSLSQHLPGRVVTAGARVPWLGCEHIEVAQPRGGYHGAYRVLRAILAAEHLTPEVIICDDDMFCTRPFDSLPAYHRGRLGDVWPGTHRTGWRLTMTVVGADALCRDAHVPTLVDRARLAAQLDDIPTQPERVWWRTLVGGGETFTEDVKIRDADTVPDGDWTSTYSTSWNGNAGTWLRERFDQASEYEL